MKSCCIVVFVSLASLLQAATTTQETARNIMGKNFIGTTDVERQFGVVYSEAERRSLDAIPFSEATLAETAETHVLFPGYALTSDRLIFCLLQKGIPIQDYDHLFFADQHEEKIAEWLVARKRVDFSEFKELFGDARGTGAGSASDEPAFDRNERVNVRWYLLRKEIFFPRVPESYGDVLRKHKEEEAFFDTTHGGKYEPASFQDLLYGVALYFGTTGERLFNATVVSAPGAESARDSTLISLSFFDDQLAISDTEQYHATGFSHRAALGAAALRRVDP